MKNVPQAELTYSQIAQPEAAGSAKELEILEQSARHAGVIKSETEAHNLSLSPIHGAWILEGNPVARNKLLSSSADGMASTFIWDCTAGRFNWYYDIDETVYVLEGSVVIKDPMGARRRLSAGDTVLFQAGTHAEWNVESYVRKIAFCRIPMPRKILLAKRLYQALRRLVGHRVSRGCGFGNDPDVA